jgi:hypothetical protein
MVCGIDTSGVLDRRNHDVAPAFTGRSGYSYHSEEDGLSSGPGEDQITRGPADESLHLTPGAIHRGRGLLTEDVDARCIPDRFGHEGEHGFQGSRPKWGGGVVIEIDGHGFNSRRQTNR